TRAPYRGARPSRMTLRRSRVAEPRRTPGGTEPASDRVQTPPSPAAHSLPRARGRGDAAWPARVPPPRSGAPHPGRLDSTAAARAPGEPAPAQPDSPAAVRRRQPSLRTRRPSPPRAPPPGPLEGFRANAETGGSPPDDCPPQGESA